MPSMAEGTLKLSGMTAILLVFQADNQHEKITDVYIGLIVHRIESHLYAPEKILDFISNIEVDLKVVHDALKAGGDPGKRHTFCLFINNHRGIAGLSNLTPSVPSLAGSHQVSSTWPPAYSHQGHLLPT